MSQTIKIEQIKTEQPIIWATVVKTINHTPKKTLLGTTPLGNPLNKKKVIVRPWQRQSSPPDFSPELGRKVQVASYKRVVHHVKANVKVSQSRKRLLKKLRKKGGVRRTPVTRQGGFRSYGNIQRGTLNWKARD